MNPLIIMGVHWRWCGSRNNRLIQLYSLVDCMHNQNVSRIHKIQYVWCTCQFGVYILRCVHVCELEFHSLSLSLSPKNADEMRASRGRTGPLSAMPSSSPPSHSHKCINSATVDGTSATHTPKMTVAIMNGNSCSDCCLWRGHTVCPNEAEKSTIWSSPIGLTSIYSRCRRTISRLLIILYSSEYLTRCPST